MILTDADELRLALRQALEERDKARAEVERLQEEIKAFAWETHDLRAANATMLADWYSQRRTVAERQREADRANVAHYLREMVADGPMFRRVGEVADFIRHELELPLVTEGDK